MTCGNIEVTKKQSFTLFLENKFLQNTGWEGKREVKLTFPAYFRENYFFQSFTCKFVKLDNNNQWLLKTMRFLHKLWFLLHQGSSVNIFNVVVIMRKWRLHSCDSSFKKSGVIAKARFYCNNVKCSWTETLKTLQSEIFGSRKFQHRLENIQCT